MKILKFVDHWFGTPVCVALSLLERITHPVHQTRIRIPFKAPPRTVLVIKFFGIGSILLSANLVRGIRKAYPHSRIIFLSFSQHRDFVRMLELADEFRGIDTRSPWAFVRTACSNLLYFSFHKPDVAVDLEFYSKFSTMMTYLSGARWRVGFRMKQLWRHPLINVPVYFNYARHILDIYCLCGSALGVDAASDIPPPIPVSSSAGAVVRDLLKKKGVASGDFLLGVNVNASELAYCRRWPLKKFAEVIDRLLSRNKDVKVVLTGSAGEKAHVARLFEFLDEAKKDRIIDLSGALSLEQFLALLLQLPLFLTNDSGPFHLAQVQRTPTVSIWGAGSPDLYGPYGPEKARHRVVYKRWPCSPCLYVYRTDAGFFCNGEVTCLNGITSIEVAEATENHINDLKRKA